jgi:2,3-bisphosphoglycerate-independent phosphoglycerate mutase
MAEKEGNATLLARTPVHDKLFAKYPWVLMGAAGEAVGLPPGQMGNSEVGHLNMGAGRIVYQEITRISRAIEDGSFFQVPAFAQVLDQVKANGSRLHLMGLCSDGGVHSHLDHLYALLELSRRAGVKDVFIHCLMDGRDTSPTSGAEYVAQVQERASHIGVGRIASIIGRYYAMDRDRRWDRVSQAYRALVMGEGTVREDPVAAVRQWYSEGKTDEFLPPTVIGNGGLSVAEGRLRDGDGFIFFNFRADRAREITRAIAEDGFADFERGSHPHVHFVCLTEYDETFGLPIAFPQQTLTNILAHTLAGRGLRQLRIAETEKYAHVTFFFSGGEETVVSGEDRCLIPSPQVATYDLQPEMSAPGVTDEAIARIGSGAYDVIVLNFANPDMVGHTGVLPAAIRAIETVDECVGRVLRAVEAARGVALVTADHGNAERMIDDDGSPFTAHTSNRVHFALVSKPRLRAGLRPGILADVAPTILDLLAIPQPPEMTGASLISRTGTRGSR